VKLDILTLFPEILKGFFESSIMARAVKRGYIEYSLVQIRDFACNKHNKCDDEIFGGGAGMLMQPGPLERAIQSISTPQSCIVYMTPGGRLFNQRYAEELSKEQHVIVICGHYEGIDQRIIDKYVDDEISIGNYILTSGETAALVCIDSVFRLIPGVITQESLEEESFSDGLLEYPQYTRPAKYDTMPVPPVLLSGHHAKIQAWRYKKRLEKTLLYRPELLQKLDPQVLRLITEILQQGVSDEPD